MIQAILAILALALTRGPARNEAEDALRGVLYQYHGEYSTYTLHHSCSFWSTRFLDRSAAL